MEERYPIVKIDRTTMQDFMPILMNKGIFSNYLSLPIKEEILETEKLRLGVTELTPELQRALLSATGHYRTKNFVVRDFGEYAVAFSANMYSDYLGKLETELTDTKSEDTNPIAEGLGRVRLFKLAHRLVLIILSKVYEKRKFTELEISKQEILDLLGFTTDDKQIYGDISDAMFSLTWLNYQIFRYRNKTKLDKNFKAFGNFIYNVVEDPKRYVISVNENFVGCVSALFNDRAGNSPVMFKRGYFDYPTSIIPATKEYSPAAYLLTNYLISENGNPKLNQPDYKVIAFNVGRFMEVMNIKARRASKRKHVFLCALREVEIISGMNYGIEDLTNITPSELENVILHISVKKEIEDLDSFIKSNLLGAKEG